MYLPPLKAENKRPRSAHVGQSTRATNIFLSYISPHTIAYKSFLFCTNLGLKAQIHHGVHSFPLAFQMHKYEKEYQIEYISVLPMLSGVILVKESY